MTGGPTKDTANSPSLPRYQAAGTLASGHRTPGDPSQPQPPVAYLILCIPHKSHANKVFNVESSTVLDDMSFFRLLREQYTKHRGGFRRFFSLRSLSEIRFVQCEVFQRDLADIKKLDVIPPITEKDNYHYDPMPADREPPIGGNLMRHLYDHPEENSTEPKCFSRVPKKLRAKLAVKPGARATLGWGICFVEGISWSRSCAFGLVGVLMSLVFGVVWTVVRQTDIQGGFGVAAYMLGVLALSLGAVQGALEN